MHKKDLKETWEEQKEHLKQKIAALTDTDVLIIEGKKKEMITKIEVKCGKTRQEQTKLLMPFRADIEIMKHIKYFNFKVPVNNKQYFKALNSNLLTVNNTTFTKSYIRTSLIMLSIFV